jgi:carbonic anhydrase
VQRNVGNLATHKDMNVMSCLEYAVDSLKVKRRGVEMVDRGWEGR